MTNIQRLTTALADRYSIERELGAGGMATVYLALDRKHDRHVAVKVLRLLRDALCRGRDPHPDGRHFVIVKRIVPDEAQTESRKPLRLFMVVNWLAELEQRLNEPD